MTGDVRRGGGSKKNERSLEIVRFRHASKRHALSVLRLELLVLSGEHAAWRERVHAHTPLRPVRGEELRQADDPRLGRAVRRRLDEWGISREVIVEVRIGRYRCVQRS